MQYASFYSWLVFTGRKPKGYEECVDLLCIVVSLLAAREMGPEVMAHFPGRSGMSVFASVDQFSYSRRPFLPPWAHGIHISLRAKNSHLSIFYQSF